MDDYKKKNCFFRKMKMFKD